MLGQRTEGKAQGCEAGRGLEEKELEDLFRLSLSTLWSLGWFGNLHLGLESLSIPWPGAVKVQCVCSPLLP